MKELEYNEGEALKARTGIEIPVEKEKKNVLLSPHPGHMTFELDVNTFELKPAVFATTTAVYGSGIPMKEVKANPGCIYFNALNMKNANKKIRKILMKNEDLKPIAAIDGDSRG